MVVFWGLVIVGLGFSGLLLSSIEDDTIEKRGAIADSIAYRISFMQPDKDLATLFSISKLKEVITPFDNVDIEIYRDGKLYDHVEGRSQAEDKDSLVRPLTLSDNSSSHYEVHVIFPSFNEILHQERKKMLIVLGSMLLLFGVFLKFSLEKILKQPIAKMVDTARTMVMSSEKTYAKFNENRSDELGYLARFMNEAIDTMREHEQSAWRAKEMAEVTLESINDGVVTTDWNGNIDFMNPSAEILSGRRFSDVRAEPLADTMQLINIKTGNVVESPISSCLSNGRSSNLGNGCALLNKNGMQIPVGVSVAPIHDHKDRVLGAVMTFHKVGA